LIVEIEGVGESSIAVLSKSDITEVPFEVVSDSGPTLPTSGSQLPNSLSVSWYQTTSATTSLADPAGNQVRPQRPLQEIVSSMQGNYNFLQDSEIDGEYCCTYSFFPILILIYFYKDLSETLVRVCVSFFLLRVIKIAKKSCRCIFMNSGKAWWDGRQLITFGMIWV